MRFTARKRGVCDVMYFARKEEDVEGTRSWLGHVGRASFRKDKDKNILNEYHKGGMINRIIME